MEGNFNLHIPDTYLGNGVLVFSFVGYNSKEVEIKKNMSSIITVKLDDACDLLGEVSVDEVYKSKQTVWQKFKGLFR